MLVLGSVLAAFGAASDAAGPLDAAIDTRVTTQKEAADSQERIDAVAEETDAMLLDFQHVSTQTDELKIFDDQLERQVETQRKQLADFERQLATVRETQREIVPSQWTNIAVSRVSTFARDMALAPLRLPRW